MINKVLTVLFLALAPTIAMGDGHSVRDRIVQELREDGYSQIRISRTFLGRTRFVATSHDRRREIVVTRTGIVLRDYIRFLQGQSGSGSSGKSSGGTGYDDDDDDDDDDDNSGRGSKDDDDDDEEDDDDNSGHGNSDDEDDDDNSGSGSSNSGSGSGSDDDDD